MTRAKIRCEQCKLCVEKENHFILSNPKGKCEKCSQDIENKNVFCSHKCLMQYLLENLKK